MIYFNDNDQFVARWLTALYPSAVIDDRSVDDIRPDDLLAYQRAHFFAGIGLWEYALALAGWPADLPVWTGSCPCQPFSAAGSRRGAADRRHLWPAWYRLIAECRPGVIFGEQVDSADGRIWLTGVQADLEAAGYAVGAASLNAAGVGAPHIRQRLYWVAYADGPECRWRAEDQRRSAELVQPSDSRPPGGMADTDGWDARDGDQPPGGQHGQRPGDGGAGGLEHAQGDGRVERRAEPGGRGAAARREPGRLADAQGNGYQGWAGQDGQPGGGSGGQGGLYPVGNRQDVGLADAQDDRQPGRGSARRGRPGPANGGGLGGADGGRQRPDQRDDATGQSDPGGSGRPGRLGHPGSARSSGRPGGSGDDGAGPPPAERTGDDAGGLGDAQGVAQYFTQPRSGDRSSVAPGTTGLSGPWADARLIYCADGRWRRVPAEPEFFPLAARSPGRVGKLRAFGNAIVPALAAQFILAFMEATGLYYAQEGS